MTTLDESALSESATLAATTSNSTTLAAGWYPDPQQVHDQRFFDGANWTKHVTHFGPKPCVRCAND